MAHDGDVQQDLVVAEPDDEEYHEVSLFFVEWALVGIRILLASADLRLASDLRWATLFVDLVLGPVKFTVGLTYPNFEIESWLNSPKVNGCHRGAQVVLGPLILGVSERTDCWTTGRCLLRKDSDDEP